MLNHLAATDLRLTFDIKVGGEFVVPDANTLELIIRGPQGIPLAPYTPLPMGNPQGNSISHVVPASFNIMLADSTLEMRFAEMHFNWQSKHYSVKTPYRLIKFMPIQVGPQEVREALGVEYHELPDEAVDIFQSYAKLTVNTAFMEALQSNDVRSIRANQVLLYTEALRIAPSLRARILKQEGEDNALYTRFNMDFDKLKAELQGALTDAESSLVEISTNSSVGFIVTSPVDRLTGA